MIGLPTHERLRRIERHLKDHDAKFETIEEELDLTDPGLVKSEAVHVREDISVSDGFEDLSEWVPDDEENAIPRCDPFEFVASINGIMLYHNETVGYLITNEKVLHGNAEGIRVERDDLLELIEMIGTDQRMWGK